MTIDRAKSWHRVDRTLEDMRRNLAAGTDEEHFQAVGLLGREIIISVAQAVFDPLRHKRNDGKDISATDANGMLEAFFESELAGSSNEEARKFAKSALALAIALQHRRTATLKDAQLCEVAVEGAVRAIETIIGRRRNEPEWEGVEVEGRYFAWSGPNLHGLQDRSGVIISEQAIHVIRTTSRMNLTSGNRNRLAHHFSEGKLQVFETDRRTWRREVIAADGNAVLLIQRPQ